MLLFCFWPPQRWRERELITVVAVVVSPHAWTPTLVDGAPAPPAAPPPPPPPPPAVGLSCATAMPPAVAARAVAPKAATSALRVLILFLAFLRMNLDPEPSSGR